MRANELAWPLVEIRLTSLPKVAYSAAKFGSLPDVVTKAVLWFCNDDSLNSIWMS